MGLAHEKLKSKLERQRAGFGWKPKNGDNRIFVLPPAAQFVENLDGVENLAYQYKGHYFRIEGRQGEASRCLQEVGKRCPACAMHRAYVNSADPALKEMAKQIRAADHYIFNVIDLGDTEKGVQRWGANWTCWTKIMEIAADSQWGYVYDPKNGIAFVIALTPGSSSRTGHNSYSVRPEPNRLNVLPVIQAKEGQPGFGLTALDGIDDAVMETKSEEEIIALLDEMGFPPLAGQSRPLTLVKPSPAGTAPTPVGVQPVPVAPAAAPTPVGVQPVPVAPAAAPTPVGVSPTPVASASPQPVMVGAPATSPIVAAPVAAPTGVHYDPGPLYVEKVPAAQRPANAPRCFGDYKPEVHRCPACPVQTDCKMKFLGIA